MSNEDDDDFGLTEDESLWVEFAKGGLSILADPNVTTGEIAMAAHAADMMLLEFKKRFRETPTKETPAPGLDPSRLS